MKKIGLALGGGAVLGAAHVGVIRAIKEKKIDTSYITGTSIGAFVAALYAFGKTWEEIRDIASELEWMDIARLSLSRYALLSNKKLGDLIIKHIGDKNIEDAKIHLAFVATDVANGEKVILDKGNVANAVMASTCIPGLFIPVEIEGKMLVDGGVVENVPINTLRTIGADYTIGVDLNSNHRYDKPNNILEVILNSFHFMMMHSSELQTEQGDLLIKPDLSAFNRSDTGQIEELMKQGYIEAKAALENLDNRLTAFK